MCACFFSDTPIFSAVILSGPSHGVSDFERVAVVTGTDVGKFYFYLRTWQRTDILRCDKLHFHVRNRGTLNSRFCRVKYNVRNCIGRLSSSFIDVVSSNIEQNFESSSYLSNPKLTVLK